jgi:hypothetical protein
VYRKSLVEPGIAVDMEREEHCKPEDMIRFLLAICCQDDFLTSPVSDGDVLDTLFNNCLDGVAKIAKCDELKGKLKD